MLGETDSSGNITASRKYDVYGGVRASTGTSTSNHKFVGSLGHPSEEGTGLIYMRARYYDPQNGRFAGEDPVMDGANWYLYCVNNPVNLVDANGCEFSVSDVLLGQSISAGLGTATGSALGDVFNGKPINWTRAIVLGLVAGLFRYGAGQTQFMGTVGASAKEIGMAMLQEGAGGAKLAGPLIVLGAAILGLTTAAYYTMDDDDAEAPMRE